MNNKRLVIGAHLSYSLLGAAITNSAGAAVTSESVKPDGTTPADWKTFFTVQDAEPQNKSTEEDIMAPAPGAYRRVDVMRTSIMTDIMLTGFEVNELILQSVLRSGTIGNGSIADNVVTPADFDPDTTLGEIRAWWRLLKYAQNDALILDWQFYGLATVKALKAENKRVQPKLEIKKFYNTLESGASSLIAAL